MKGVILDKSALNPGDLSFEELYSLATFDEYDRTMDEDVLKRAEGKEIIITNKVPFNRERMLSLPSLKYIGVTATGYNIIDVEAAKELGIAVTNIPSYSTDAVAEHVFALLLEISKSVSLYNESVKRGDWERSTDFCYYLAPSFELSGKRLGIIGLGNIGKRVSSLAKAFNMEIAAYSPHSKLDGVTMLSLDEILKQSDIISLHTALTNDTFHLINKDSLSLMKDGAILINVSRGDLIDEDAVINALDSGKLSYYASDVLSKEPPKENRLSKHRKSIITPHIAWASLETRERLLKIVVENLKSYMEGGSLNRIV